MPDTIYGTSRKNRNVSETVYNILHGNIVNLNLVPGTLMSEKDIAEKMSVSRTPVREAFIKLSKEGLVNIYPQKGTFVSKIDLSIVEEERFLRESIEFAVMELFIKMHTDESIDRLYRNLERQKRALKEGDYIKFIEYDDQFHAIIYDETKKRKCYGIIQSFCGHYRRIRFLSMSMTGVSEDNAIQHEGIIKAVESNDLEKANAVLKKHLKKLVIEEDEICENYPDYFELTQSYLSDKGLFEKNTSIFKEIAKKGIKIEK
jgi:GntR family transcriptional regulator, rspAB operon transcriptional repressor